MDWQYSGSCSIVSPEYLSTHKINGWKYALTSGGYDPIHTGHISCMIDGYLKAAKLEYNSPITLVVVVNGDEFLKRKKGKPFMPLKVRCQVIAALRQVDFVVPFEASDPEDMGVSEAIELIKPDYFLKGGDRTNAENIPEWGICNKVGTQIITGCGDDKYWSSSNFIKEWEQFKCQD